MLDMTLWLSEKKLIDWYIFEFRMVKLKSDLLSTLGARALEKWKVSLDRSWDVLDLCIFVRVPEQSMFTFRDLVEIIEAAIT